MRKKVSKAKRRDRLKHRQKKLFLSLCIIGVILIFSMYLIYSINLKAKLKDISYAIEYHLTSNSIKDDRLLELDNYTLLFSDDKTALVEAYGTTYKKPHTNTIIQKTLKRNKNGYWKVEN